MVPLHVPIMNEPAGHVLVHVVQAVCVPAVEYVPVAHAGHSGVAVDVHDPVMNVPAPHDVVQAVQALCDPDDDAYDPTPHPTQLGAVVGVHVPLR